jgi:cytochrome c5
MMKRLAFRVAKLAALCGGLALALASYFSAAASRGGAVFSSAAQNGDAAEFFEKRVRPLLVAKCQMCHSAEAATSGLDMSSAEGFRRGGASGPLVNLENPEASLLLKVISYDGSLKMPPMGKLKDVGEDGRAVAGRGAGSGRSEKQILDAADFDTTVH